jgi:arylsulfatase A-like enzyme
MRFLNSMLPVLLLLAGADAVSGFEDRPNILWISCEDISPHLGCYGDRNARTPNLDQLAREGTLFTHAFSCHGVCAPSRTGIITGIFPVALGANHMRSRVRLPEDVRLFPELLRNAGYYCTNNSKTDYNIEWVQRQVWDDSSNSAHWKNRSRSDQPFFSVFNLTMTHESKVWPKGWQTVVGELKTSERHAPAEFTVPPIYPDTEAVRGDLARIADLITVMDRRVGKILQELEDAGLADRTVVMFWSDHGDGLPRAKRWTYDSGTRVPLVIRVPEKYLSFSGSLTPGSRDERMVSLLDLGPTVLHLAGVTVPEHMHGRPVLGPQKHGGYTYIHGARDRLDERQDLVRSIRTRKYRYVRNLMPWYPALQHVAYGEQNETLKEMRGLLAAGTLSDQRQQWFRERRAEELYDLDADPWEIENLAEHPEMAEILTLHRAECDRWQRETLDVHLIPEVMLEEEARRTGGVRARIFRGPEGRERLARILEAAKSASAMPRHAGVRQSVADEDPVIYWWNLTGVIRRGDIFANIENFREASGHTSPAIRILGAIGLARAGKSDEVASEIAGLLQHDSEFVRQAIMREIDEAGVEVVRRWVPEVKNFEKDEYFQRLLEHARTEM